MPVASYGLLVSMTTEDQERELGKALRDYSDLARATPHGVVIAPTTPYILSLSKPNFAW